MKNLFATRDLSDATRGRIQLAFAVARERLLATHVDHALALIRLAEGKLSYPQAMSIYARMLGLTEDEAEVVATRAFATLGEEQAAEDWPEPMPVPAENERVPRRRRLLDQVRHRLRGRVDDEFRQQVEFWTARAEVALLEAHIENALEFLDILEREQTPDEAVELYLNALEVRDGIAEVVYFKALAGLADRHLPEPAPDHDRHATDPDEVRLRVLDRDRDA